MPALPDALERPLFAKHSVELAQPLAAADSGGGTASPAGPARRLWRGVASALRPVAVAAARGATAARRGSCDVRKQTRIELFSSPSQPKQRASTRLHTC